MYRVFISILLEVHGMKTVEIITLTLEIFAKVALLVDLVGAAQKMLTRFYAVSNLNLGMLVFNEFAISKCASL